MLILYIKINNRNSFFKFKKIDINLNLDFNRKKMNFQNLFNNINRNIDSEIKIETPIKLNCEKK